MKPVVGNVTVGASGADARSVPEVNGLLQFFVNVIPHFVAGDAELLGIGDLHRPVETAPEDYAADTASDEHRGERKTRSWRPEKGPDTRDQSFPGFRCASAHVCPAALDQRKENDPVRAVNRRRSPSDNDRLQKPSVSAREHMLMRDTKHPNPRS